MCLLKAIRKTRKIMISRYCLQGLALFTLIGCSVGPKYDPPAVSMPCQWHSKLSHGMQSSTSEELLWWKSLNDPVLDSLIERASCLNLDLSIAASRIQESRVQLKGASASLYPHVDGSATYGHVRYNKHTLNHALGTHAKHNEIDFFEAGFDAEWEIDLFGKSAHEIKALKASSEATEFEYSHLWISISAEVARNYIELRGLQMRLQALNKEINLQTESLQLSKDLAQTGFSSSIDAQKVTVQLSMLAAQKPELELSINKSIYALSVLLGYAPGALFDELDCPQTLPMYPCNLSVGIPSELLRRRPDIMKAERDLAAATESVGSAVAALFPRLSLRGFIGDIGAFGPGSFTWFAGPQVLFPILNSKLLQQDVKLNKIKVQQALYAYEKTVLKALEEAENAIASLHAEEERNNHLKEALQVNQEIYDQMLELYEKGFKSYIDVVSAGSILFEIKDAYLQSQSALLLHYVALYKALGGGVCVNHDLAGYF